MRYIGLNRFLQILSQMESSKLCLKKTALVLFPFLLYCVSASAQGGTSAKEFLSSLYKGYQSPKEVDYLGKAADSIFTPELLKLIREDEKQADGEVGNLNYDPICNCQDFEISGVQITIKKLKKTEMEADVHFVNSGTEVNLVFRLVANGSRWRIGDIKSKSTPSLYQFLQKNLKPIPREK